MAEVELGLPSGTLVASRYRIVGNLGYGGMATVHRALDTASGREVALKRIRPRENPEDRHRAVEHLEHEFHTLSQLEHPRVVSVYDYGLDGAEPYYTMELLDGGDVQERSPLDWRMACVVARDVCSALSLLHSRRLVHRDLSPRNVRCTSDGRAKLIDFGAMVPMGPTKSVVGTPAICAPELVRLQPLDGRTDLYALGATLYCTLTGQFPYPARTFNALEGLWKHRPQLPSEIAPNVPAALDALVMDLLQLDPSLRPFSASEVMQRLQAIAGLAPDETALVSQAYLATPTLVGREAPLSRVGRYVSGLQRGTGRSVWVDGVAGVGRTRFLDACILEAKLIGATVARADASDAADGDFGVARALAGRLLETVGEAGREAAKPYWDVLSKAIPGLGGGMQTWSRPPMVASSEPGLQPALRAWFLSLAQQRPLVLAVDDIDLVDEASVALLALLAKEARKQRLLIATSASANSEQTAPLALRVLAEASVKIELSPLMASEVEALLCSVFGDVPNLPLLVSKLYALSEGRPRDVMLMAQHLVDKKLLRYGAGEWSLPARIDASDLPASLADALVERVARLGRDARELAQAIALSAGHTFDLNECARLLEQPDLMQVRPVLDELLLAGVLVASSDRYALGPQGWSAALLAKLDPTHKRRLHASLARLFEQRGDAGFLTALHLFAAGDDERGLDVLIAYSITTQALTDKDTGAFVRLVNSMPVGWLGTFDRALTLCATLKRPKRDSFMLQRRVLGLASYDTSCGASLEHYVVPVIQLSHDCGLDILATLDPALDPKQRVYRALALAKQRYDSLPEHERVLEPGPAAAQLARVVLTCVGVAANSFDRGLLQAMPSLHQLAPLSSGIAVVQALLEAVDARLSGKIDEARARYLTLIEQVEGSDLDETYKRTSVLGLQYVLSNLDASMGLSSCLDWIERIAAHPLHEVNAYHARGLYHVWRADPQTADRLRVQAELLMVQQLRRSRSENMHMLREVVAYGLTDDLTRVRRSLDMLEVLARRFPDWRPVLHYARGEHARICGDYNVALENYAKVLDEPDASSHQVWAHVAGAEVLTLSALGRHRQAQAAAVAHLAAADAAGLDFPRNYIRIPLAIAAARSGEFTVAQRAADAAVEACKARGSQGLNLALAHEARAWVAVESADIAAAEVHVAALAEQLRAASSHTLMVRYERLRREARRAAGIDSKPPAEERASELRQQIVAALTSCGSTEERARRSLDILMAETGSVQGYLFAVTTTGCSLAASHSDQPLPAEIEELARRLVAHELNDDANTEDLDSSTGTSRAWRSRDGRTYRSIVLGHTGPEGFVVTGLGVLLFDTHTSFKNAANVATELSRHASVGTRVAVRLHR